MRQHMDSIRVTRGRPTIALVLSGGGAKGAAQLGVKKLIDELEIPIDLICGTSIGGMVGGLFATGYTPEFIDSLFRHQDWSVTLSDKVDPSFIPMDTKMYRSKFLVSIPFHYQDETFAKRVREQEIYSDQGDGELHLGANSAGDKIRKGINTTASSLPSGYAYGFNVNNLLASLTVGYQDSISFKDLPIPFVCVAADLSSCKAKNWGSGNLKTAMRSTMSIPGLFNPVRTQGMVLVDGGVRNNFPVDIARAMGADYVIGVELSDKLLEYSELNNLGNMVSQFIDMLGKEAHDRNVGECDIFIKPNLDGYNMLSFNPEAIDTMANRGRIAALAHKDELMALKDIVGDSKPYLQDKPAVDISHNPVMIAAVEFKGLTDKESKYLQQKTGLFAGQYVSASQLNDAMSKIQATGCFESVTYSLLGKDEPFDLVFDCAKGPVHQVGLGIRADNVEYVSLFLNLGLNTHKLTGSKFDFNLKLGPVPYLDARYCLDLMNFPTINADFKLKYGNAKAFDPDLGNFDVGFWSHRERIYLSNIRWTRLDIKLGVENQYFCIPPEWFLSNDGYELPPELSKGNYTDAFVNGSLYTMDDLYYPSSGVLFNVGYDFTFAKSGKSDFKPFHILALNWKQVFPIGTKFAIIPEIHLRNIFNNFENNRAVSLGLSNYVGGGFAGRYVEQSIPLAGFSKMYVADDHVGVANIAFRLSPFKDFYVSAQGGILKEADKFGDLFRSIEPDYWSTAIGVGYDSIFGPLGLELQWSKMIGMGFYLSLGYDF